MGRPQLVSYRHIASLYIAAVEAGRPPVAVCSRSLQVDYDRMARRLEDLRLRGWLPPGPPASTEIWVERARALCCERTAEQLSEQAERQAERERRRQQTLAAEQQRRAEQRQRCAERERQRRGARLDREVVRRAARTPRLQYRADQLLRWQPGDSAPGWREPAEQIRELWERIELGAAEQCWLWTGPTTPAGYGQLERITGSLLGARRRELLTAHRAAWLSLHGELEQHVVVDQACHHLDERCADDALCLHRRCCNPGHLVTVTLDRAAPTHCALGHPLSELTTRNTPRKVRDCLTCREDRRRREQSALLTSGRQHGERSGLQPQTPSGVAVLDVFVGGW